MPKKQRPKATPARTTTAKGRTAAQGAAISDALSVELWNEEDAQEAGRISPEGLNVVVFSRDWTVQTVVSQIEQGNIDLEPDFQRRNAWRDARRSRLIESFILNFPVPQVVLAEHPSKPKAFIVIDGKQRLMTIAGFFLDRYRQYWEEPRFSGLEVLKDLNRLRISEFLTLPAFETQRRELGNADIRTTVVSKYSSETVLYDIFYRLNTGSVPLSSQELRQVLNQGGFAKYLILITDIDNPIRRVLGLSGPDARLRDVEILLRLVAWGHFASEYVGNMKPFLDKVMKDLNERWKTEPEVVKRMVADAMFAAEAAMDVFGDTIGHKFKDGRYESATNRTVFELQTLAFSNKQVAIAAKKKQPEVLRGFRELFSESAFLASLEATTKSIENYQLRFDRYRLMLQRTLGRSVDKIVFGSPKP